jgi:hypothetical protein
MTYLQLNHSYLNYMNQTIKSKELNHQLKQQMALIDIPLSFWWNWYSKGLFILVLFWNPNDEKNSDSEKKENMYCFLTSLFKMFPKREIRKFAADFLNCEEYVINVLEEGCKNFFISYPSYLEAMKYSTNNPDSFLRLCLQSTESLFIFVYLFQSFILCMHNKQGHHVAIPHYTDMKYLYNPEKIDKYDWGRPLWFILHTVALYAPDPLTESFKNYKQILSCLQHLLPCPKCRFHLSENLLKINLDKCARTREELFKCSWELHNIVNKDTNKREITFNEALQIYKV